MTRPGRACCPSQIEQALRRVRTSPRRAGRAAAAQSRARPAAILADVRGRVFDGLEHAHLTIPDSMFPFVMVEQHEQQHVETMLATHQLRDGTPLLGPRRPAAATTSGALTTRYWCRRVSSCWVSTATPSRGRSTTSARPTWSTLPAFRIGRVPVTNAEWQQFMDAGGYDEPRWWSAAWLGPPASRPVSSGPSSGRSTDRAGASGSSRQIPG